MPFNATGQPVLALKIFTETTRSHRQIAGENRNAIVENVDVRYFVANVDEADRAAHGVGIVDFECVVKSERIDVHRAGRDAGFGKDPELGLDEVALGGDEEHAHLVAAVAVLVQNLEIELHRVDVRYVLLRFPPHQLARLLLLDALGLDPLDDDVAAAYRGNDRLGIGVNRLDGAANDIRDQMRIHHFAFHDCIVGKRSDRNLDQFWSRLRVIDDGDLHQA